MFDMMKMMGKVKEMQSKMKEAQEEIKNITVKGEAGAGLVEAVASGHKQLISLKIDESLLNKEDEVALKDLIVAAVNQAMDKADEEAKEYIKKSTDGILPNIPGMDFSGMM